MSKYFDGQIVSVEDVIKDFDCVKRNNYLCSTSYESKDGLFVATIFDGATHVLIEREY